MSLGTIIIIILVIALLGGFSGFGGGPFYGNRLLWRRRPRSRARYCPDPSFARQTLIAEAWNLYSTPRVRSSRTGHYCAAKVLFQQWSPSWTLVEVRFCGG